MHDHPPESLKPNCQEPTPELVAIDTIRSLRNAYHNDGFKLTDCAAQAMRLWEYTASPVQKPP